MMKIYRYRGHLLLIRCLLLMLLIVLPACNLNSNTVISVTEPIAITPEPTSSAWTVIADGLESRVYIPNEAEIAQMMVLRIDPTRFHFRAVYRPGDPLSLSDWQRAEPDAIMIINTNFFSPDNTILGLLISDGQIFGQSYTNRGGTFAVQNGVAAVRANRTQPYQGEPLEQAVQAFPLLVENGQAAYFNQGDTEINRRTLIAQDTEGHILIMATPFLGLSLTDLSAYLPTTDLNIVTAFNLDGGGSTMMAVSDMDYSIPSFDRVPAILAVYPRE